MPAWVVAVVVGSLFAFALGSGAIAISPGPAGPLLGIAIGYLLFGGGAFWYLRDEIGEDDGNRRAVRREALRRATETFYAAELSRNEAQDELARRRQAWEGLLLVVKSQTSRLLSIDPGHLHPDELEQFVGHVFRQLGYDVQQTGQSGDQGVDVLAQRGLVRIAVQVKCYSGSVGNSCVQEVYAGMAHYRCHRCAVVTNSYFTSGARELAMSTGCVLVDRDGLPALIRGELL